MEILQPCLGEGFTVERKELGTVSRKGQSSSEVLFVCGRSIRTYLFFLLFFSGSKRFSILTEDPLVYLIPLVGRNLRFL